MKYFIYTVFFVILVGCEATQPTKQSNQLYLDQSVLANKNTSAGWLAYGMALTAWEPAYLGNGSPDYFNREVYARQTAAQIWKELKQNNASKSDADLDILEKISDAGFMDEYLWVYLKKESWVDPGNLELEKFKEWAGKNLINHVPIKETGVSIG